MPPIKIQTDYVKQTGASIGPMSQKISDVKEKDPLSSDSMREYTCNKCGKPFFTREDLRIHQEFEGK